MIDIKSILSLWFFSTAASSSAPVIAFALSESSKIVQEVILYDPTIFIPVFVGSSLAGLFTIREMINLENKKSWEEIFFETVVTMSAGFLVGIFGGNAATILFLPELAEMSQAKLFISAMSGFLGEKILRKIWKIAKEK